MPLSIRRLILFSALAVAAVAVMIFVFSAQEADASSQTSAAFSEWLLRQIHPDLDQMDPSLQASLRAQYHLAVRKAAHFSEFALLGLFLRLLLEWLPLRWKKSVSWAAGTLYAVTDEIHQMFVAGRSCQVPDVCIDSLGVLTGVFLMAGLIRLFPGRKRTRAAKNPK